MKIFFGIIIFFSSYAYSEQEYSLKINDLKSLVETRNERVISKNHQTKAWSNRHGFLKRSFLPSLKLYGAHERFQLGDNYTRTQPTYGGEISVNLFNGTRDSLNNKILNKKKVRSESEKKVTLYHEIIKAKETYWNLVYIDKTLILLDEIKKINLSNLTSAQRRVKTGVTTRADLYEFQIKDTELKRTAEHLNMQKEILKRELLNFIGFEEDSKISLADKMDHFEGMEKVNNHSEAQHQFLAKPYLVQAEENELSAKMQSRSWWPRIDGFVALNQYNVRNGNVFGPQEGKETVVGLRASMNLFDFTTGNKEAAALYAESESSKSEAKYLEREIENEAHSEITYLNFLHQQIHDAEENIKRAQDYLKLTLNEYSKGVKNSPDVLGSIDKLLEVKSKYNEMLKDFYITRDHLLSKSEIQ